MQKGGGLIGLIKRCGKIAFGSSCLLGTNVTISAGLSGLGDLVQQKSGRNSRASFDWTRTIRMSVAGSSMGFICHYWYLWLDKAIPGSGVRVLVKKIVWDQCLLSPVLWIGYFLVLGAMEQSDIRKLKDRLLNVGSQIYLVECVIWPPAQAINFYYLPTRFRVLYDNFISLGFDIYTSYLINDAKYTKSDRNFLELNTI